MHFRLNEQEVGRRAGRDLFCCCCCFGGSAPGSSHSIDVQVGLPSLRALSSRVVDLIRTTTTKKLRVLSAFSLFFLPLLLSVASVMYPVLDSQLPAIFQTALSSVMAAAFYLSLSSAVASTGIDNRLPSRRSGSDY